MWSPFLAYKGFIQLDPVPPFHNKLNARCHSLKGSGIVEDSGSDFKVLKTTFRIRIFQRYLVYTRGLGQMIKNNRKKSNLTPKMLILKAPRLPQWYIMIQQQPL